MVAKIKSGKSLTGALNYNENKIREGKAELIQAEGYYKDMPDLNFYDKLLRLTDLAARNERTTTNAVHISLNFANGELLDSNTLQEIIKEYMVGIGFEGQPFLGYRHHDAGHPHVHIVTTNIQKNGERISLHLLGRNQSEQARKAIEIKYKLVKAEDQKKQPERLKLKPAEYGKTETKRAITNIVREIIQTYKFTSIPELNAVLGQFNITADRGSKDSRMFAKNGLVYWITDSKGNKMGVPIKASCIYGKPTLKKLEEHFRLNEALRKPLRENLRQTIDQVMRRPLTRRAFQEALKQRGIQMIFRQNEEGRIYGITFVDDENKAVFNGSDLGKAYSAAVLTDRLSQNKETVPIPKDSHQLLQAPQNVPDNFTSGNGTVENLLDILFQGEKQDLAALNKFKTRKKRKGLNL